MHKKARIRYAYPGFIFLCLTESIFLFFVLGFHKVQVTNGCGKADKDRHNDDKEIGAVCDVLFKHIVSIYRGKSIPFPVNNEKNFVLKLRTRFNYEPTFVTK